MTEALQRNSMTIRSSGTVVCTELRSWPALLKNAHQCREIGNMALAWCPIILVTYPTHSRQLRCDAAAAHHLPRFSRGSVKFSLRCCWIRHYEWAWWSTLKCHFWVTLALRDFSERRQSATRAGVTYIHSYTLPKPVVSRDWPILKTAENQVSFRLTFNHSVTRFWACLIHMFWFSQVEHQLDVH